MRALLIFITFLMAVPALAATDPTVENRAREIGQSLRCVVCQNQSIEESDAPLAGDMRALVRERVAAGDSNEQVVAFMRERYGDYVLLRPPVQSNTYVLWFLPFGLALLFLGWFVMQARRRQPAAPAPVVLSDEDRARLERLKAERDT